MPRSKAGSIVRSVLKYFEAEAASNSLSIPIQKAQRRTSAATGVSMRTIQRIKKEASLSSTLTTPGRKRGPHRSRNVLLQVGDFELCAIRRTVYEFYADGKVPSLSTLLRAVKENVDFPWKKGALWKILHKIGFRWKRCRDQRTAIVERQDVVHQRHRYLRAMKQYRDAERHVIYLDETFVDGNLCFGKCWQLQTGAHAGRRNAAARRLILVQAGGKDGFVTGARLVYEFHSAGGDLQGHMNFDNFSKWLRESLLPNIPDNSVICMDGAPYHSKILHSRPSRDSTKKELSEWLEQRQIPHDPEMRKTEMYDLVVTNAPPSKRHTVDELLKERGHDVLRIPPYHCDLNVVELAWASAKRYVRERNGNAEMNLKNVIGEALLGITKEEWNKYIEHVVKVENKYWELDGLVEEAMEKISFVVGTDSSSDDMKTDDSFPNGTDDTANLSSEDDDSSSHDTKTSEF